MKNLKLLIHTFLILITLASSGVVKASQDPIVIPNTGTLSGLSLVNLTNAALGTLNTGWSGSSAPGTPATGQTWLDTSVAGAITIKLYDGSAWVSTGTIITASDLFQNPIGGGTDTIASASTTDVGSKTAGILTVSGTTTINSLGTSLPAGQVKFLTFSGALQLTHNATSLILPGNANITTAAGDTALAVALGSGNFRVPFYQRASGATIGTVSLTSGVSGVLPEANGGTNQSTYTTGDLLYASGSNTLAKRAIGSSGNVLTVSGGVPTWAAPAAATLGNSTSQSVPTIGSAAQWTGGQGFIVINITTTQTGTNVVTKYELSCDTASTPTNIWDSGYFYGHSSANWQSGESISLKCPIKNNDYYRVVKTNAGGSATETVSSMYFRSLN